MLLPYPVALSPSREPPPQSSPPRPPNTRSLLSPSFQLNSADIPSHPISPSTESAFNARETFAATTSITTAGNTIHTVATRGATAFYPGVLEVAVALTIFSRPIPSPCACPCPTTDHSPHVRPVIRPRPVRNPDPYQDPDSYPDPDLYLTIYPDPDPYTDPDAHPVPYPAEAMQPLPAAWALAEQAFGLASLHRRLFIPTPATMDLRAPRPTPTSPPPANPLHLMPGDTLLVPLLEPPDAPLLLGSSAVVSDGEEQGITALACTAK